MPISKSVSAKIQVHFATLPDPRRRKVKYPLINFIVIAICAVICGADDFVAISNFGRKKRRWFRKILDLRAGIPSHDRFNAIFSMLSPAEFERCLLSWIQALHEATDGQVIAIDGKTLRGSFDKASNTSAFHMISAWASVNSISLGQLVVDAKSNEITAIPKWLDMLQLTGATVTIDAASDGDCPSHRRRRGALRLQRQGESGSPSRWDRDVFRRVPRWQDVDGARLPLAHHREGPWPEGIAMPLLCSIPRGLPDSDRWPGLKAIGMVISNTERDGKECISVRYYILSRKMPVKRFAAIVKGHWAIENELHWQLDVTFREDHCRIRKGNADANFSILRRIALMLLKNEKTAKLGVKNKRLSAGWDEDYLLKVLVSI